MVTGLIIGLSATFLPKLNEKNSSTVQVEQPEVPPIKSNSKRKFDFYTLLPELEVVVDENNDLPSSNQVNVDDNSSYILQVGSFKNHNEADSLKAQLALMGVETNIETVTVNSNKWHRVRIGPSQDKSHLLSIQKRLHAEKMDSVLLKVRS